MYEKELLNQYSMSEKIETLEDDNKFSFEKVVVFDGEEYNLISAEDILYIRPLMYFITLKGRYI
jgi:hypothetical protein